MIPPDQAGLAPANWTAPYLADASPQDASPQDASPLDAALADALYLEHARDGASLAELAAQHRLSAEAVQRLVRRGESRLLRQLARAQDALRVRHTLQLETLFRLALEAWEQSRAPTVTKVSQGSGGKRAEQTTAAAGGNPRYLTEARAALAEIRALWGVSAARGETSAQPSVSHLPGPRHADLDDEDARFAALVAEFQAQGLVVLAVDGGPPSPAASAGPPQPHPPLGTNAGALLPAPALSQAEALS